METYAARLASFNAVHPATKKRASDPHGKRKLKWPHKKPDPAQVSLDSPGVVEDVSSNQVQLAQAGFSFTPTSSCPDNVTCYVCGSCLDGWEDTDDPIDEHLSHSGLCGWAITLATERAIENGSDDLEDPLSEAMLEARRMTFACGWPHESKRGWLCKTKKVDSRPWIWSVI